MKIKIPTFMSKQSFFRSSLVIIFSIIISQVDAQSGWHLYKDAPTNLSPIHLESTDDGTLYMLTKQGPMYYREATDDAWTQISNVHGFWNHDNFNVHPVNKRLFVGTGNSGIVYTDDYGEDWDSEYFFTLENSGFHANINAIAISVEENIVLLAGGINVDTFGYANYRSSNNGNTWQSLDIPTTGFAQFHVRGNGDILASGKHGLFTLSEGLFLSENNGTTWTNISDLDGVIMTDFAEDASGNIYATVPTTDQASGPGVYMSVDDGNNWSVINTGLSSLEALCITYDAVTDDILVGTKDGLYRLETDSWTLVNMPFDNNVVNDIIVDDGTQFSASSFQGVYQKEVDQADWEAHNQGITGSLTEYLFTENDQLLGSYWFTHGYSVLEDANSDWENSLLPENIESFIGVIQMEKINSDEIYMLDFNELFYSSDDGQTFENITPDLPIPAGQYYRRYEQMEVTEDGEIMLLHFNHDTLYHSTDAGETYDVLLDINDVSSALGTIILIDDFVYSPIGGYYVILRDLTLDTKLMRSVDGEVWQEIDYSSIDPGFNGTNHDLYTADNGDVYFSFRHQPYLLNPADNSFSQIPVPWTFSDANSEYELVIDDDDNMFITVYHTFSSLDYEGVWRSTDGGLNWTNLGFPEDEFGEYKHSNTIRFNSENIPFILSGISEPGGLTDDIPGVYYYGEEGIFVGLDELFDSENPLLVYPNPILPGQEIYLTGEDIDRNTTFVLFDVQGRVIPISVDYAMNRASISTSSLSAGVYTISVDTTDGITKSVRLILH